MKRIIIFVVTAIAVLCSCERGFETAPVEYTIKYLESDELCITSIFNCDEGVFLASNDLAVRTLASKIPSGVSYEITRADGSLMCSSEDLPQGTSGKEPVHCFSANKTYLGTTYDLTTYYPDYINYPYEYCGNMEPLTTVATCNNYWKLGDNQDMNFMAKRQYYATDDLNKDCGTKSYYTRVFFGGVKHSSSDFDWWKDNEFADKDAVPRAFYNNTITGLRLVINPNGTKWTPAQDIKDVETGIIWHLADIYFDGDEYYTADNRRLGADLNDGGAGDFLYLYYTEDLRTGRKIMITNPYFKLNASLANGSDGAVTLGLLGSGLLTWNSHTWKVDADELLEAVGNTLKDAFKPYFSGVKKRVDFIRLYDKDMKPYEDDWKYNCPANFNRNARGKDEIFISYNFITPEDKYWNY